MAIITWKFAVCLRIYRFYDLFYRYFRLKKIKKFIRYFVSVRNFVKKFRSRGCEICLL